MGPGPLETEVLYATQGISDMKDIPEFKGYMGSILGRRTQFNEEYAKDYFDIDVLSAHANFADVKEGKEKFLPAYAC